MPVPPRARSPLPALGALLALAAAAFARTLDGELQFDDFPAIVRNPLVREPARLLAGALEALRHGGRPLTEATFALNVAYGGLEPRNFHLTTLLLHLAATALAFAVGRALLARAGAGRPTAVALAAAGVFAVHPLQSQAVAYVVQRGEVLAGLLALATVGLLLAAEDRRGWRAAGLGGAALVALALGLAAKASAVVALPLWLLSGLLRPPREAAPPWPRRLAPALPLGAVAAAFAAGALGATAGSTDAGLGVPGLDPWTYLLTQRRVVATYLRLILWPSGQSVDWDVAPSRALLEPAGLLGGLLLLALVAAAVALARWGRRREGTDAAAARVAAFGLLWLFVALAPTSSVLPLADVLVEHRLYLALLGPALALAAAGERAAARLGPRGPALGAAAAAVVVLALAAALHARNAVWASRRALWTDAVAKAPGRPRPLVNLAQAAALEGRPAEGAAHARAALDLVGPGDEDGRLHVLENLGQLLLDAGQPAEARDLLRAARREGPATARLYALEALALTATGAAAEGEGWARLAVQAAPSLGLGWRALGEARLAQGRPAEAAQDLVRALALDPEDGAARRALGQARRGAATP